MILEDDMKFIAIGELMLRLSPPNYEKLVTTHDFRVNYGGAEAKEGAKEVSGTVKKSEEAKVSKEEESQLTDKGVCG